ncbi:MAG: SAM-dependent chlorinase/fluorinase, partial [Thermodesulfobacterium sp.]|nr:SAM-dependent chlorinase/fluorinase [Thermodesulfobacterium sp.]
MSKIISLLTDFGVEDHYVGVVKGRILKELEKPINVNFIDITHNIPPQDVKKAALSLYFSYRYFPEGTIFLIIVDPGVGTERRAVVVKTKNFTFVGPDNGVFSLIYKE